jgi:radical S-adenosyl methionine domain-containing protein 2
VTLNSAPDNELVINWHITEACNYRCRYCYAKWDKAGSQRELIHDHARSTKLLEELAAFFRPGSSCNPLSRALGWRSLRLNLAGGEPLLYRREVLHIAHEARRLGFAVSIITNASCLDDDLMGELAGLLSVLGISIDSAEALRNQQIGRADRHGHRLESAALVQLVALGRLLNPALRLKINTVVNALNHSEDMAQLLHKLAPEKWKVLRMLPSITDELAVSTMQFDAFVSRHRSAGLPMYVEDNTDMRESYIMVDPDGRFFQNSPIRRGYHYSPPILDIGAAAAFGHIQLAPARYLQRYALAEAFE